MITEDILSWFKTFFVHGEYKNIPEVFDVDDDVQEFKKNEQDDLKIEGTEPQKRVEKPSSPKYEDQLLNTAYQFGKEDPILKLIRDTLREIREFEDELDNSFEQLNNKFDQIEYQYDTTKTK